MISTRIAQVASLFAFASCYLAFKNLQLAFHFGTSGGEIVDVWDASGPTQKAPRQQLVLSNSSSSSNSSLSLFSHQRTSRECRLQWDLEKKTNLTNTWLEMDLPILISAIRHDRGVNPDNARRKLKGRRRPVKAAEAYKNLKEDMVYITFTQHHCRQKRKVMDFKKIPWKCIYGSSAPKTSQLKAKQNVGITMHQEFAQFIPPGKQKSIINLMCNSTMGDNSTLVLTGISPTKLPNQNSTDGIPKEPFIYNLVAPLECDRLEEQETAGIHEPKKLGACLRFKGDFDRSLVPQWIEYHRILGIEHFWVYINEEWNLRGLYNTSYITYVPHDLNWDNHKSHFHHHYVDYKPKISQEPASYACMWNAKKYGYDWVTTTDVDEWIRVPAAENETETDISALSFPLRSYLTRFDPNIFGCFIMKSIAFGRNKLTMHRDVQKNPLLIDYVWRQNKNLSKYSSREKGIYNPQSVWHFGVHYCWRAQGKIKDFQPQKGEPFMQHYKLAHKGVYRALEKKMVESEKDLLKDPAVRDMYRSELAAALENLDASQSHASTD